MHRTLMTNYRGFILTRDTRIALHALEERANNLGKWKLDIIGPMADATVGPSSLIPAGREIHVKFRRSDRNEQDALNAVWACAIPLGFTPNDRWPRPSGTDHIFYFLGPWQSVNDRLLSEGRGHLAWPSVCCAAQVDVGVWKGDKAVARFVQTQLHRIGRNVGPIDGIVGRRTKAGMGTLGLGRPSLALAAAHLQKAEPQLKKAPVKLTRGHLSIPGHTVRVQAFGAVKAQQHGPTGAFLSANGDGRFVVEVTTNEFP